MQGKTLQPAVSNKIVLKEAEIFDNVTGVIEVPSSALTVALAQHNEICLIIDTNKELLSCGVLEEAYLQLLRIIHTDAREAALKYKSVLEGQGKTFEHALFVGWINTLLHKYAPPNLYLVIRQGVIAGILSTIVKPAPLKVVLTELTKYVSIKDYYIGTYEQLFICNDKNNVPWAFIYSDVNKYPPTLFKGVKMDDNGEIQEYENVYTYTKNGKMETKLKFFIREKFSELKKNMI